MSFGLSVASAGDVNGDGYGDVIVGAPYYTNGQSNEGRAYVYHGSSSGIAISAAWTAESNQASAWFGYSVASAGDVNGDGYGDVIVGAYPYDNGHTNEGAAFVYHGSSSGLDTTADWAAEGNQNYANFGCSAASAGDVNGDGYGDVIVGAYRDGSSSEGHAHVYHGNGAGNYVGENMRPQALRSESPNQVIAPYGLAASSDRFNVKAYGRPLTGRGKMKLQVEVKPLGQAFDGTSLQTLGSWTDSGTGGQSVTNSVTGLGAAYAYHWRARMLYHPAHGGPLGWSHWAWGGKSGEAGGVHVRLGTCGDGYVQSLEDCDGTNIPDSCESLYSEGGTLACDACEYDTDDCGPCNGGCDCADSGRCDVSSGTCGAACTANNQCCDNYCIVGLGTCGCAGLGELCTENADCCDAYAVCFEYGGLGARCWLL